MSLDNRLDQFKEKLDAEYAWPSIYMFKFIVPNDKVNEIEQILGNHETTKKASSKGTYISVTCKMMASSADDIINVYKKASTIEGVMSL
ncbi:MAG: DUF493 domain-containing protein [Cyclobacteriaceae bacterium]|nr:DUF493 domain-containing protein [Cyclobacteriaceae bacterium]MCH8515497.1 DUF493 domain-containing protein [Cyclobacteriaceae bacterium]